MKRRTGQLFALWLGITLSVAAEPVFGIRETKAVDTAPQTGLDPCRLARIPERMQWYVNQGVVAGAVTLVARHGEIAEFDAVGYQDLERKVPMATNIIFQIMSMTKPITGIGIMMLFEEARLGLNDRVDKYLPEFRDARFVAGKDVTGKPILEKARPITIRDLMTHTAGVCDGSADELMEMNDQMRMSLADAVKVYASKPLNFDRDTQWKYSSPGIAVLGRIIEVVSGRPYDEFVAERLLRPLGMRDSFFFAPEDKKSRVAMVYHQEDGKLIRSTNHILGGDPALFRPGARYPAPEWGLYSTAADLAILYQMLLDGGVYIGRHYLSRPAVELMTQIYTAHLPHSAWGNGDYYGLTWEVVKEPPATFLFQTPGTYGHGGAFGTQGWIDPGNDMIRILMVQDSAGGAAPLHNDFFILAGASIMN